MSRSFLLAFSLGLRSAPFVSQGMLLLHVDAMFACNMSAGTACQLLLLLHCCCHLLLLALALANVAVVNVNIIDYAVLAGPLRIPN